MVRFAFTLWFTVAALAGPWVCCCSLASSPDTTTAANSVPASKPVKSCCQTDAQPCGEHGKQDSEPSKPSKCPCEHSKQATSLSTIAPNESELLAQLKLIDALFVGFMPSSAFDFSTVAPICVDTSPPVFGLSGRDLLTAYSVLRC